MTALPRSRDARTQWELGVNSTWQIDSRGCGTRRRSVLLVLWAGCSDENGDDIRVAEFRVNECGSGTPSNKLLTGREPHDYPNLQCVAWKRAGAKLNVDLINFPAGCGFRGYEPDTLWKGRVRGDGSKLDFEVTWDFESANACGGCLHDFSFALEGIQGENPIDMDVAIRDCSDCDRRMSSLTLPTDEHASGITCKYGGDASFHLSPSLEDQLGSLHAPPADGVCDAGLEPIKIRDQEICVAACSSDDDECQPSDVLTCQKGNCLLRESW